MTLLACWYLSIFLIDWPRQKWMIFWKFIFFMLNSCWYLLAFLLPFNLQLVVSSLLLWREIRTSSPRMTTDWKSVRLFPIPSIIYLIHNNVQFATLTYVDTSTYQIMGNLKIVTTGLLFRFILLTFQSCKNINAFFLASFYW